MLKNITTPVPVIYDGDMGGDDIWGIMMALGNDDIFDVKAITSVFGNVDCDHATRNILDVMSHFGIRNIPVAKGAEKPFVGECMFGDGAYGDDGIGGVVLEAKSPVKLHEGSASELIINTVMQSPDPVTVFATGPLTNIALALKASPEIIDNIDSLILMGGGLQPGPHPNVPGRSGNITVHSEFNFFQDPYAVNAVMNSGVNSHIMTMDASQHLHLDPEKRKEIESIKKSDVGIISAKMLAPAEALDRPKFGVNGPFIHDPNVIIYRLNPDFYQASIANVSVEEHPGEQVDLTEMRHGKMHTEWNNAGRHNVVNVMKKPDAVFSAMKESIAKFANKYNPA